MKMKGGILMKKIALVIVLFAVGLVFVVACATTSQFTPLPWGVKVISPSIDIPKEIAAFSGIWYGIWDNGRPTTLVVQKIKSPKADVIYSWGPMGKEREGGFAQYVGEIKSGKLEVVVPERQITITYLLSGDETLKGEFRASKSIVYVTMRRQPPK